MVSMMLTLIIFDIDGTLVNAYPAIYASFNYTMRSCGYPVQVARVIKRAVGRGDAELLKPFVRTMDRARSLEVYRVHHQKALVQKSRLYPGVKRLLGTLRERGLKLAVASNRPTHFSELLLRHLGVRAFFARVLCKDAVRYGKPHPQILNKIMLACGASPAQTLYVGDMVIDAKAARRAGVKAVIVTTGSSTRQEIARERPYKILSRVADLGRLPECREPMRKSKSPTGKEKVKGKK
jgi:phosphoglycolate phosphatase